MRNSDDITSKISSRALELLAMRGRVITEWKIMYVDPITVAAGELISVGKEDPDWPGWRWCRDARGKEGWVPEAFISDGKRIARDYTARELAASPGDEVEIVEEAAGWMWCTKAAGASGWMPARHLSRI
jgi:SH3-like domain-containing protein